MSAGEIPVTVTVDSDDLREWAGRHADAGHHGVAHVLYQAAKDVESITEQHDREVATKALRDAADALVGTITAAPALALDRPAIGRAVFAGVDWLRGRADLIEAGEVGL